MDELTFEKVAAKEAIQTATIAVFRRKEEKLQVLIGRHKNRDHLVLPGGHRDKGESIQDCARRELKEETGVKVGELFYIGRLVEEIGRKRPRYDCIFAAMVDTKTEPEGADDLADVRWVDAHDPPELAYRHRKMIQAARDRFFAKEKPKGMLIAFEGVDGSGKSTQVELLADHLTHQGIPVVVTKWNSSDIVSAATREGKRRGELSPMLFSLLHASDLLHRYDQLITPALEKNYVVIADRYTYTSRVRDGIRGVPEKLLDAVYKDIRDPDIIFHCKVPVEVAMRRTEERNRPGSQYATGKDVGLGMKDYYEKMDVAYAKHMAERRVYAKLDTSKDKDVVADDIWKRVEPKLGDVAATYNFDVAYKLAAFMSDYAPGIPDKKRFGNLEDLPRNKLVPYVVQRHLAERAGPHYDIRFGPDDMYSFATKKEMPQPGGKIMVYQQPLHRGAYANFEGVIREGYGKGVVKKHDQGKIIVQHADQNKIKFIIAHKRYPEFYTMVRRGGPPTDPKTPRQAQTQGGSWLMINTTPMDAAKMLGGKASDVGLSKLRYTSVPAEKVDKLFDPKYLVQEKIDGASALYHLLGDKIDTISYRVSKTGRPIIHTYRVFGPGGSKKGAQIPPELQGTILRGEIYGTRKGKAIPPQELGGLLNSSVANSLQTQKAKQIEMKNMLFDIVRLGKQPIAPDSMGAQQRLEKLREISSLLPKDSFHLPETAETPEAARKMWEGITTGQSPRTAEGVVGWPVAPGKKPIKVKATPEADVFVRSVFPGEGRLGGGAGAGGFEYSNDPAGPVVGRVGTGFSDETRSDMLSDPDAYIGRMARIRSQGKFPSGAHRAPVFHSLHEDYPMKSAARILMPQLA